MDNPGVQRRTGKGVPAAVGDVSKNIRIRLPVIHRFQEELRQLMGRPDGGEDLERLTQGKDPGALVATVDALLAALDGRDTFQVIKLWMAVAPAVYRYVVVERGALPADRLNPGWDEPIRRAVIDLVPVHCCDSFLAMAYPGSRVRCPFCGTLHTTPAMSVPENADLEGGAPAWSEDLAPERRAV